MKKKLTAFLLAIALCFSVLAPVGTAKAATAIKYDEFTISENEVYSFRNVASGWYMNVKNAGKTDGTQINLYPLDMTEPMTQRYVFHVIDENKKIVQISPQPAQKKYLDVRRRSKPFAEGQGICIWQADGDPIKNLVLDIQADGSFYLSFSEFPEYCIGAKSKAAADTYQTQLVVRKKVDAPELRWILCDENGLPINDVDNQKTEWNNPYYEKFGQSYIELFKHYPIYLSNETFLDVTGMYWEECNRVLKEQEKNTVIGAYLYSLDQGTNIILYEILSKFGLSKSFGEKMRFESVNLLLQDMCRNQQVLYTVAAQVEKDFSIVEESYSLVNAVSKAKYISDLSKATALPKGTVERIVTDVYKEADQIESKMQNKVDVVSYITTVLQLYSLDQGMIDYMMEAIAPERDLYRDLQMLKDSTGENSYKHIMDKFFNEQAQEIVGDLLVKTLGNGSKSFKITTVIVEAGVSLLVNHVYQGALADEIIQTTYLHSYTETLHSTIQNMQSRFIEKEHIVTKDEIEQYEFLMSAYLSALKTTLQSAQKMEGNKIRKSNIQNLINSLEDWVNYEAYVALCIKEMPDLQKRMDDLVERLNRTYFTVNQKTCSNSYHSSCKNCKLSNIIRSEWFEEEFGTLYVKQFPKLTVDASGGARDGWTCFGFTCFAEYYINAKNSTDSIETKRVATGTFSKDFIKANVKPGDALRVTGPHSMIVYAVEEDGIVVIDCNRSLAGYGSCVVQKDKILYTSKYAGRTLYVDRATCNME